MLEAGTSAVFKEHAQVPWCATAEAKSQAGRTTERRAEIRGTGRPETRGLPSSRILIRRGSSAQAACKRAGAAGKARPRQWCVEIWRPAAHEAHGRKMEMRSVCAAEERREARSSTYVGQGAPVTDAAAAMMMS